MLEIILDLFIDPILAIWDLVGLLWERRVAPEKGKLYPREEDVGPITEEERLRDRLEDRTRCLNKRM